ncbi:MAG: phosphopantothenoylcysteine decarboxylase [Sedimentisphaerales bacterium]|nr:phosphopantothenoylcysteine decarboxylase [Sedimentisphaerales bacterium]
MKRHFLITAGGTREYIDPVRFISNASSGKMGYALGRAALRAGHKVTLITGPSQARTPNQAKIVKVQTAGEMFKAVRCYFWKCDCLIMAAAVSDYTPVKISKTKIKKARADLNIKLKPTTDILKWAGANKSKDYKSRTKNRRPGRFIVGFALEDRNLRANADGKLKEKNLDMIIANYPAAISADKTSVQIRMKDSKWQKLPPAAKTTIAGKIIKLLEPKILP